ncbi:MAG: HTH domain-containing protein [Phycisphaerae bacterium]|nr:HTH domain-containing protein [Phycisphaerae bacterium]
MVSANPSAPRLNGSRVDRVLYFLSRFYHEPEGLSSGRLRLELGISRRTFHRYIERLGAAGIEISYDPISRRHLLRRSRGISVDSGLTADEMAALLLHFEEGYTPLHGSSFEFFLGSALRRIIGSISNSDQSEKVSRAMASFRREAIRRITKERLNGATPTRHAN